MESSRQFDALCPDGGWHAWMMVGCASWIAFWYVGTTYSWGVQGPLVDSRSDTGTNVDVGVCGIHRC
jgi:hypothetical protein